MRRFAVSLLVLAACPAKQPESPQPQQPVAGVGCPRASDIYLAQYVRPDTFAGPPAADAAAPAHPPAGQGYTGWTLPLHNTPEPPPEGTPAFQTLDAQSAAALGIPAPPPAVWLMLASGYCKATPGNYYAVTVPADAPNRSYGVELTGCAEPQEGDGEIAIAMVSAEPPTQCVPVSPVQAAARLGTEGQNNAWTPPANAGTPIPPAFAQQLTAPACSPPACEALWTIGKVDVDGKTVAYAGAVNWAITNGSRDACTWTYERYSGVFSVGPDGALTNLTDLASRYGHKLSLIVALADSGGAKALILDGPGEYATFDIGAGTPALGRHLQWFVDNPDAYAAADHLGPACPK